MIKPHNLLTRVPLGDKSPREVNAIIEIPKGASNKYEYVSENDYFKLDRALYESVFYPTEYGFIPGSWNEKDNDPLDIMVFSTYATFPGCVVSCRPIGLLRLIDSGEEDFKIIAVSANDPRFEEIRDLDDLPLHLKKEIKNFWENYVELQPNKKIQIQGWSGKEAAWEMIKKGKLAFSRKYKSL